jgi:hypothetical protein
VAQLKCDRCRKTVYKAIRSAFPGEPCPRLECEGTLERTDSIFTGPSRVERGKTRTRFDRRV